MEVRPWLEPALVQRAFVSLAGKTHPDSQRAREGGAAFQEVTQAHQVLRDPVRRLEAVLQRECPEFLRATGARMVPTDLPDLFMSVATLHRQITAFCGQRKSAESSAAKELSPLSSALARSEVFALRSDLDNMIQKVNQHWARCENQVRAVDAVWERRTPEMLQQLASVYREMCYLQRWKEQLKEADVLLKTVV